MGFTAFRKRFGKRVTNPLWTHGCRVFHHGVDVESANILKMAYNGYEPETTRVFLSLIRPGIHFADVGAYLGYYSLIAAAKGGEDCKVWAFEPLPSAFDLLKKNVAENRFEEMITPVQKAVGKTNTTMRILRHGIPARSSLYFRKGLDPNASVEIDVVTLDSFFAAKAWPRLDLIKIDVEGAEKDVFWGMMELNWRNDHLKMIVEYAPLTMRAAAVSTGDFFEAARQNGFEHFYLIEQGLSKISLTEKAFRDLEQYADSQPININVLCTKQEWRVPSLRANY